MGNARTGVREGGVKRQGISSIPSQFLDDLNLRSLTELPPLEDLGQLVETVAPGASIGGGLAPEEDAVEAAAPAPPSTAADASPTIN